MTFFEANQFLLKYIARFIQDFRVRGSVCKQFALHERIPYRLALRDFSDLLCISHPDPFDSHLIDMMAQIVMHLKRKLERSISEKC